MIQALAKKFKNDPPKVILQSDPAYQLSLKIGVNKQIIFTHLTQIGNENKKQKQKRLKSCVMFLSHQKSNPIKKL